MNGSHLLTAMRLRLALANAQRLYDDLLELLPAQKRRTVETVMRCCGGNLTDCPSCAAEWREAWIDDRAEYAMEAAVERDPSLHEVYRERGA